MKSAGFKPAIPEVKWPQTNSLYSAATEIYSLYKAQTCVYEWKQEKSFINVTPEQRIMTSFFGFMGEKKLSVNVTYMRTVTTEDV